MPFSLYPGASAPDFHNNRRQAAIDHLLKIGVNPFEATFVIPEARHPGTSSEFEDRYIHEMRTMPRLPVETAWELADMRAHIKSLSAHIAAQRGLSLSCSESRIERVKIK
ncbi:hypothetical protein [Telmatospirillum siberiense]|uniref:Uncharacterized protein n=1 Tax=Telmatospirillum siberiense TaxID=382514 RepID=A0A2N3PWA6_9PROT|nr:hypothetical protein [Telmatospirillum siberiense]PKU24682.1 hypothetical protein CWS72_10095 [Telmatospirillum siberiense]